MNSQILLAALAVVTVYTWIRLRRPAIDPAAKRFMVRNPKFSTKGLILLYAGLISERLFGKKLGGWNKKAIMKQVTELPASAEKNFGNQAEIVKGYEYFVDGLEKQTFSAIGRAVFSEFCLRLATSRSTVITFFDQHPETLDQKIVKPLIITGLPRSGSTLLLNLLSQDQKSRGLYFFEMVQFVNPLPLAKKETFFQDPRIKAAGDRIKKLEEIIPGFLTEMSKSHPSAPDALDEELLILMHQGMGGMIHMTLSEKEYADWYMNENNKAAAYTYFKRYLQMLQSSFAPESHWVTKAPMHIDWIGELLKTFPDARIVVTHRDPKACVPSFSKYIESQIGYFYYDQTLDRRRIARDCYRQWDAGVKRLIKFRENHQDKKQFCDVAYQDLVNDPSATVEGIYKHFGMDFTDEMKQNISKYMKENPQGKHGRAHYSMEMFDQTDEQYERDFADYYKTYAAYLGDVKKQK